MAISATSTRHSPLAAVLKRELPDYPSGARRAQYLGIVVLVTIVLYYQNYIGGAVGAQILADYHISFLTFALIIAGANAIGAIASLAAGVADRVGRANLAVYGLIICSLITLFWVPNAHSALEYFIATGLAGLTEGVILVATPALVRDFSPQVGRAQAMAFWTMGPVLGSLIVTEVSSHTLDAHSRWQDQYVYAGIAGLVVSVLAFFLMRELSPEHRNRIVGAIEAETEAALAARGLSAEEATRHPFRQMLKPDILLSSVAISVFLLLYYTAVGFLPTFFQTVQGFTAAQANDLLNYLWIATAASMLIFGILSDKLRVRKPFMLAGGVLSVVIDLAFLAKADDARPSFASIAVLLVFSGIWAGGAYVPWMASFTETVERRNPALSATGLAVWGWILRIVVAGAFILIPTIVPTVTSLVNDGPTVQAKLVQFEKDYPQLAAEAQAHPSVFTTLASYPDASKIPTSVLNKAINTVGAPALTQLQQPKAQAELKYLGGKTATKVAQAQKDSPGQWQHWFGICTLGAVVFCPLIFLMAGAWRPRPQHDSHAVKHALDNANHRDDDRDLQPAGADLGAYPPAGSYS